MKRLTVIGHGTREDLDKLMADVSIDFSAICSSMPITHPAGVMKGISFPASIASLAGYADVFQDTAITDQILNLSEKEVKETYGSMAAICLGNAIKVIFSDRKYILMTSINQVGAAIGNVMPRTISAWSRGERQRGTELSDGEIEQGLTGTCLEHIQIESYDYSSRLQSADDNFLGFHGVQGARRLAVDHGNGLKTDTKVGGTGGHRNDPEWQKNAKKRGLGVNSAGAEIVYIDEDDKNNEAKALFGSQNEASRHSHKKGKDGMIQNRINHNQGLLGDSSVSKHEDLRAVVVSDLDDIVGPALAKRIREQIDADEANLRSRDYLAPYVKGTQASKDRKKKRRESAASAFFAPGGGG